MASTFLQKEDSRRALSTRRWIDEDPTAAMQGPKYRQQPTLPFTREEMETILATVERYPDKSGRFGLTNSVRLRAFVLLLRYSGMRIGDAVSLRPERLDGSRLFLFTQKTGVPVYVLLPVFVTDALRSVPRLSERHFFWTGESSLHTAIGTWQRTLRNLFKLAGVPEGHAHRFRDTFATELLLSGVPIEQVSMLLGHSSIRITETHLQAVGSRPSAAARREFGASVGARSDRPHGSGQDAGIRRQE